MSSKIIYEEEGCRCGAHVGKFPTFKKTIDEALQLPIDAFQIYISNSRGYGVKVPTREDVEYFKRKVDESGMYMCIHGCLLYNLCGSVKGKDDIDYSTKLERTVSNYRKELDIGVLLGDRGVVIHTGSYKGKYEDGIALVGEALTKVLTKPSTIPESQEKNFRMRRRVLIENCAGEGTKLGKTLEEVRDIINSVPKKLRRQISVCIDTAHIFGAGQYNFGNPEEVRKFFSDFDTTIGLHKLEVIHLNDSKVPFGSKKDRHENIGRGHQFKGEGGLTELYRLCDKYAIPLILETPGNGILEDLFILSSIGN